MILFVLGVLVSLALFVWASQLDEAKPFHSLHFFVGSLAVVGALSWLNVNSTFHAPKREAGIPKDLVMMRIEGTLPYMRYTVIKVQHAKPWIDVLVMGRDERFGWRHSRRPTYTHVAFDCGQARYAEKKSRPLDYAPPPEVSMDRLPVRDIEFSQPLRSDQRSDRFWYSLATQVCRAYQQNLATSDE